MTMTISERETLQKFINGGHAGTLHKVVAALANVALKQEAIRIAQAAPGSLAIAKCARCGVDLFPGDDFNVREENGAAGCWRLFGIEGKPCFRGRAAIADRNPTGGDVKQAPSRSDESGGAGTAIAQPRTPISGTS